MPDQTSRKSDIFFILMSVLLFFNLGSIAYHNQADKGSEPYLQRIAIHEKDLNIRSIRAEIKRISSQHSNEHHAWATIQEIVICGPGGCKKIKDSREADLIIKDHSGDLKSGRVFIEGSIRMRLKGSNALSLEIADASITAEPGSRFKAFKERLNAFLKHFYDENMSRHCASIAKAIVLADSTTISPNLYHKFSASGTAHLLAVSGLHVYIILYMASVFLKRLFLFLGLKKIWVPALLLFLLCYNFMVVPKASILRASVMFVLFALTSLFGRKASREVFLFYSYILLAAFSSRILLDIGFYLSFLAMGAIVYIVPLLQKPFERYGLGNHFFFDILLASTAINIALIPLLAHTFKSFSTVFILSNVVCMPIFTSCSVGLFSSSLIALFFPQAGAFLLKITEMLLILFIDITSFFADFKYSQLQANLFASKTAVSAYYILLSAIIILARKRTSR